MKLIKALTPFRPADQSMFLSICFPLASEVDLIRAISPLIIATEWIPL